MPRIARKGIESNERLGRYRWVIERTMAWFSGYRRLTIRYERKASHFAAFLTLAPPSLVTRNWPNETTSKHVLNVNRTIGAGMLSQSRRICRPSLMWALKLFMK